MKRTLLAIALAFCSGCSTCPTASIADTFFPQRGMCPSCAPPKKKCGCHLFSWLHHKKNKEAPPVGVVPMPQAGPAPVMVAPGTVPMQTPMPQNAPLVAESPQKKGIFGWLHKHKHKKQDCPTCNQGSAVAPLLPPDQGAAPLMMPQPQQYMPPTNSCPTCASPGVG
ncbi:hypothetical protein Pan216_26660 [Planctomycetes bacterium Pan216]|uniref:Uncharacterized protein n=1 Tax=Kolteria novifilia TaxID=2527975 RepID=A0A518B492_9BACT|nr:hypothetical protein Pan216_26660 [Planctomycetes bacterium Pan216]